MKLVKALIITFFLFIFVNKTAHASEGLFEIRSTDGNNYRCFAVSLLMLKSNYQISVSCRDLIYPPRADLFNYVMWTSPDDGTKPQKLGTLGVGKANFETKKEFSTLFVTIEENKNARSPSDEIVMEGDIEPIEFLEEAQEITPTPESETEEEETQPEASVTEAQEQTTTNRLGVAIRRAGLIIFVGLVTIAGLVFVLTRPKK